MGKGRGGLPQGEREGNSAAVHQCLRAQTLLPIRILLSQQPRIVGLKQKAMQSECTHLMFALAFPVTSYQLPVTVAAVVHSDVPLGVANSVTRH